MNVEQTNKEINKQNVILLCYYDDGIEVGRGFW